MKDGPVPEGPLDFSSSPTGDWLPSQALCSTHGGLTVSSIAQVSTLSSKNVHPGCRWVKHSASLHFFANLL